MLTRRGVLRCAAFSLLAVAMPIYGQVGTGAADVGDMVVTLVGTGGPELTAERSGEATLVQAAGQDLLFDAGRDTLDNLYRSHVLPQQVTRIFLTHLHSDHIDGLPDLWMTPWFLLGRTTPLEVWGPAGTGAMIAGMRAMYAHDLEHRANPAFPAAELDIAVHEVAPGRVYAEGGVTVTAFAVEHADGNPAFGYRVDAGGHSAVMTGDCTLTPALTAAARGAELVISNVVAATGALEATPRLQPILAKLMRPEQAAALFTAIKPRLAAYSHIVKKGLPGKAGDDTIVSRTRAAGYAGPLLMGYDHTQITLGKAIGVRVMVGPLPDLDGPGSAF